MDLLLMQSSSGSPNKFLQALAGKNSGTPPIWLMRQAGRYLPEYQRIRKKYPLEEMFCSTDLIVDITQQPITRFGFDAAIIFADILHVLLTIGCRVSFPGKGGPVIEPPFTLSDSLTKYPRLPPEEICFFVKEAICRLKRTLSVPLLGFCGDPFTLAHYLIGRDVKKWLYQEPDKLKGLLELLMEQAIAYVAMQIDSGVDAIQIFSSSAHLLSDREFALFAVPYIKGMIGAIGSRVPTILFARGSSYLVEELVGANPSAISCDWSVSLLKMRRFIPQHIAIQGNIDPYLLYASSQEIIRSVREVLQIMDGEQRFILNLGHGILPDTPIAGVEALMEAVRGFSPRGSGRE